MAIRITSTFGLYYFLSIKCSLWIVFFAICYVCIYRPDLYVPKCVIFGRKIGLNPDNVVSCYKIVICILVIECFL